jgi:hypothetical protein
MLPDCATFSTASSSVAQVAQVGKLSYPIKGMDAIAPIARSVQLQACRREDHFPEVRLVVSTQGAAYGRQGLDRQGDESGIPQRED